MKKYYIIGAVLIAAAAVYFFFFWKKDQSGKMIIPFIAHQPPQVDPHLPHSVSLSDKLDEVLFDGLFNIAATPSGIIYEDGLGEFIGIDERDVVTIRIKPQKKWHDSYFVSREDDDIKIESKDSRYFNAEDLRYTLRRIERLGSRSPDYILLAQAIDNFDFDGPDRNNEIRFRFRSDRAWVESDIKEILSFKIIPAQSADNQMQFRTGSGPYLAVDATTYHSQPGDDAEIPLLRLEPYIDNSTFTTELNNNNINILLDTPFGSISPILTDSTAFFTKSNISSTFFAILFNTSRLNLEQRRQLRLFFNNRFILNRFFKTGSEQQRHLVDYRDKRDNYEDYLNYSVFPSTTIYIDEEIVVPQKSSGTPNLSVLPDSILVRACLNFGYREEYRDIIEILKDPAVSKNRLRVSAFSNEDIKSGNYDALLVAFTGYRSNYLFDLYDIFFREPDLATYRINLKTITNNDGRRELDLQSYEPSRNFFRLNPFDSAESETISRLLNDIYGFMSSSEIYDKHVYAQRIDLAEHELALGTWIFSLPSLAYFSTQFDEKSIDLYGKASQLSTIEKWRERKDD
jgi:hypothetical protein